MNNLIGLQQRQSVARELQECHEQSDLFSEYINQIILRAPLIYVFINIILVIWIAQTIFSSHLNAIPNSLYYLSPLLAAMPLTRITVQPLDEKCPAPLSPIPLKSLPTIYSNRISHQEIFGWDTQPIQFCSQEMPRAAKRSNCEGEEEVLCSGYCVKTTQNCPITNLKITTKDSPMDKGYEEIYLSPQGKSYRISRAQGVPIVAISAAYATKCANDEHYNEAFNNQADFWKKAEDCGKEGTIGDFFTQIDQMQTNTFFAANHIPITTTNTSMMEMALGVVSEFHLSNDPNKGCGVAYEWAQNVKKYFTAAAPAPQFSGVLTGFSFVLLIANLLWLLGYYNIPQWMGTMNIITLGIAIIEQVIVGFIYSNNVQLFQLEKVTQTLRGCLQQQVPALKEWDFGMQSPQAFQMLLFINTAYLGLHISALLFNHFCMQAYRRQQVVLPLPANSLHGQSLAL